jgi:hypothetical protein
MRYDCRFQGNYRETILQSISHISFYSYSSIVIHLIAHLLREERAVRVSHLHRAMISVCVVYICPLAWHSDTCYRDDVFAALEKEIKYNRKIVPRMDLMPNTELAIYAERWWQRGSEPSSTHPTPWLVLAESSFLEFGIVAARVEIWRRDYKQIFKILRLCTLCRAALQLFCFQHYHLQHSLCTRFKIKVNCDTNCNSVKIKIN